MFENIHKFHHFDFQTAKDVWNLKLDNKTIKVFTVMYRLLAFNKRETQINAFAIKVVIYTLCICKSQNFPPFKTKSKNILDIFQRTKKATFLENQKDKYSIRKRLLFSSLKMAQ